MAVVSPYPLYLGGILIVAIIGAELALAPLETGQLPRSLARLVLYATWWMQRWFYL